MLNLQELERRLDEALANETADTLSNWLLNERKDNLERFLGNGCIANFKRNPYSFFLKLPKEIQYTCNNKNEPSEQLATAA